jgi:hypothetical protein
MREPFAGEHNAKNTDLGCSAAAAGLARIGGTAILALAIICWLARSDTPGPVGRSLIVAMLFYNFAVVGMLASEGFGQGPHGMLLWPAVIFHMAMGGWCVATLCRNETAFCDKP